MRSDCRMLWLGPAGPEPLHKFARVRFWPKPAVKPMSACDLFC